MDPHTLTFYLVAAGLSFCLSLVLVAVAHIQSGTLALRGSALALLAFAVAFFVSGYGPLLPRWTTVVGINMLMIAVGVIFHTSFAAHFHRRAPVFDRYGWALVAATAVPFWYWGLVEPDGVARSVVFSLAMALATGRTALLLLRHARARWDPPVLGLGVVFAAAALWMLFRVLMLLAAVPVAPEQRGANPTGWVTVFGYNILAALMTAGILWMEVRRLKANYRGGAVAADTPAAVEPARGKLLLLWGAVAVLCLAIAAEVGIAYGALHAREHKRLLEQATLAVDALAAHAAQTVDQVDVLLHAVRGYYRRTASLAETGVFVENLGFSKAAIENIYLIGADGAILTPWDARAKGLNVGQRDYFAFHRDTPEDRLFIGPVQTGRVTGKRQFRLSRRIDGAAGRFAGVVLAPLEPQAFSDYFERVLGSSRDGLAVLVGTDDRKIRARLPAAQDTMWDVPVVSPLWDALDRAPQGSYRNTSFIDGIEREFVFRRVAGLPLVVLIGFSSADVRDSALRSVLPIGFGAMFAVVVVLTLAIILTASIRRRDEQENFISMLSHELKTPLSVIRMTLGQAGVPEAVRGRIARSVAEMNALIERCVQADRLRHGLIASSCVQCRIDEVLAGLRAASAAPERIAIEADDLPACMTDVQLFAVIVGNLLDNALKYGRAQSGVSVRLGARTEKMRPGILVEVENAPGSAGIPDAAQVFRKYYRARGAHGKTGSGLGLHISAGFARLLGGELRYRPDADKVKFELWIPCQTPP